MISIIIPAYNAAETINRTLDSIYKQTYQDFEVIIVDDGSTDNLQAALLTCPNRFTLYSQDNKGAPAARNHGFRQSHGEKVIFLDADIEMAPTMLAELSEALDQNPQTSFAYSSFRWGWKKFKLFPFDYERLKKMPYIHTSALIRREAFPGFDESLKKFQDWDLFLTIAERGGTGIWIDKILFSVKTKGTMSSWLPSFVYTLPFLKLKQVEKYNHWRDIVLKKHGLN